MGLGNLASSGKMIETYKPERRAMNCPTTNGKNLVSAVGIKAVRLTHLRLSGILTATIIL
jgi:hypothetical protein